MRSLRAYAEITFHRGRHSAELAALVHRAEHVAEVEQRLVELFGGLFAEAAGAATSTPQSWRFTACTPCRGGRQW